MASRSIDYSRLPEAFKPPVDNNSRSDRDTIVAALPLAKLPKGLTPLPGLDYQPPKFNYGWPYMGAHLIAVAEKRSFLVPGEYGLSVLPTMENMLKMLRELGVTTCTPTLGTKYLQPANIITLTTNYKAGNRLPPAEEVAVIQEFLEFTEPPMWYLDRVQGVWGWRHAY